MPREKGDGRADELERGMRNEAKRKKKIWTRTPQAHSNNRPTPKIKTVKKNAFTFSPEGFHPKRHRFPRVTVKQNP